ncbi:sodium-dependent bicarbonate transport family permease [bacterium]|nr:sodium-dependent bicarbonate transport family permease [bacterium]
MQILKDPPILFFILGLLSVLFNTGLRVPAVFSKFLALYLLMAIGFKGGLSLANTGFSVEFIYCLLGGIIVSIMTPIFLFYLLKSKISIYDSAAIGATYGSVSAVTFVAATTWLDNRNLEFSGSMIAVLALMEAPAIIVSLFLVGRHSLQKTSLSVTQLVHEALLNGSVFLLIGSVIVGYISGPFGKESVGAFVLDLFKGFLTFFLLDLGIKSGTSLKKMQIPLWLIPIGILTPIVSAGLALAWGMLFSISATQTFLLMTLAAGASYIAVPAALKQSLPQANAGIYLTMALGVTFPFNILIGLPLYWYMVSLVYF